MHYDEELLFAESFQHELIVSELLRVRILASIVVVLMVAIAVEAAAFPGPFFAVFPSVAAYWVLEAILAVFVLYELGIVRTILRWAFEHPAFRLPPQARYMNALIETSLPTAVLLLVGRPGHPDDVLASPPAYAYFLFIILSALRLDFKLSLFTGAVAAAEYGFVSQWALAHAVVPVATNAILYSMPANVSKVLLLFVAGVATGFTSLQVRRGVANALRLVKERNNVLGVFGQHVSPEVVEALLKTGGGEFESQTRSVCVMFLDIRDFTTFSEKRRPEEVVAHLNALFDFMIEIVNRHHGIINKFLGDGFMAIFGAPLSSGDDVRNAVRAAVELVDRVNAETAAGTIEYTRIGIGLHSGMAVTGTVGSKERREYTIIGDTVNLAARIEQLNKQFGTQLLCSESVRDGIGDLAAAREVGNVTVKGREQPVRVYELAPGRYEELPGIRDEVIHSP